jgi:hypothetical protein
MNCRKSIPNLKSLFIALASLLTVWAGGLAQSASRALDSGGHTVAFSICRHVPPGI